MGPAEDRVNAHFRGAIPHLPSSPVLRSAGKTVPNRWASLTAMPSVCSRCVRTCTSGAATGLIRTIMRFLLNVTRWGRRADNGALPAEDRGGTMLRSRAAQLDRAFHPHSNTRITDFAWHVLRALSDPLKNLT